MRRSYPPPTAPFVEARCKGGRQKPTAIILKSSYTTSVKGAALAIALNWNGQHSSYDAAHYVVDEATTYQCVWDRQKAIPELFDARNAILINVCHNPSDDFNLWEASAPSKTLDRTVQLVAELTLAYRIPTRYLYGETEDRWLRRRWRSRGGVIVQIDGAWPASDFMKAVVVRQDLLRSQLKGYDDLIKMEEKRLGRTRSHEGEHT